MIPNVWMTWCHRKAKCNYCEQPITVATPMVIAKYWNRGNENRRGWNILKYYHPECWVSNGLDYLLQNPYQPRGARRGPKVKLPPEQRRERYLLIRRYHAIQQRRKQSKVEYPDKVLVELKMDKQEQEIISRLLELGGVPQRWLKTEKLPTKDM